MDPLNILLYKKLMSLQLKDRVSLFDLIHFYVSDTTFVAHVRNINLRSQRSIEINCELLHGFNNQPGLRDQVARWLTEALEARLAV
jgi:hypothetical protein